MDTQRSLWVKFGRILQLLLTPYDHYHNSQGTNIIDFVISDANLTSCDSRQHTLIPQLSLLKPLYSSFQITVSVTNDFLFNKQIPKFKCIGCVIFYSLIFFNFIIIFRFFFWLKKILSKPRGDNYSKEYSKSRQLRYF